MDYQEAAYKHSHKVKEDAQKHLDRKLLDSNFILSTKERSVGRLPKLW